MNTNQLKSFIKLLEEFNTGEAAQLVTKESIQDLSIALHEADYYSSEYVRVALIGEYNSGKSTLLNAILGKYYASTDFCEMM